jgi:hypothetical protein
MDEHKKAATERLTGTKTKLRLVSAKLPFPNERAAVSASAFNAKWSTAACRSGVLKAR